MASKKCVHIFGNLCCMRDQCAWESFVGVLGVGAHMEKKNDKIAIVEIVYLKIVFGFDFKAALVYDSDLKKV